MKLIIIAGPPSAGKTAVVRQIIRSLSQIRAAFLKIDVVCATEDEEIREEFCIPSRKIYSGDLCPDHAGIMILDDAITWAIKEGSDMLVVESAGLCLRCTPYTTQSLGIVVLSAISGIQSPAKMAPMIALADIAVVTRIDLVSQAEKEVFREKIRGIRSDIDIVETNAVQGTGMRYLTRSIETACEITDPSSIMLRGIPPLGVCTVCIGKKNIGWKNHSGVLRQLDGDELMFRGD
ncbi:MAG: cobalamin biosynthesis protein [Methanomicrobiales archaeon]|nr:cobalamin biosynthesis protein [Methanomicrobiales archaeon]